MARSVTTLVPVFGSARMNALKVGDLIRDRKWVGVCFAGGMSEMLGITAQTLCVNDRHRHIINLARHVADPETCKQLMQRLDFTPFHPDVLLQAQRHCEAAIETAATAEDAYQYFLACWLGRSGKSATDSEFSGGISTRFTVSGGASGVRFRSAVQGLVEFQRVLQGAEFSVLDVFEFLDKIPDEKTHAIYSDAPSWPGAQDLYRYKFTKQQHQQLATKLCSFQQTRVVVRYNDCPEIRALYPEELWEYGEYGGRDQANQVKGELLLVNKCSL